MKEQVSRDMIKQETEVQKSQFLGYQTKMNELNRKVKESLQLLETTHQAAEREMHQRSFSGTSRDNLLEGSKINKPPTLCFQGRSQHLRMSAVSKPFYFRSEVLDRTSLTKWSEMHWLAH